MPPIDSDGDSDGGSDSDSDSDSDVPLEEEIQHVAHVVRPIRALEEVNREVNRRFDSVFAGRAERPRFIVEERPRVTFQDSIADNIVEA